MKRLPPVEKIYEAYGAVADGRVTMPDNELICGAPAVAYVISPDGSEKYAVSWIDNIYSSDDNVTRRQGCPGYPVIAVLLKQGRLPLDHNMAEMCSHIDWTELRHKYHGNYSKALHSIIDDRKCNASAIYAVVQGVYAHLETLPVIIRRIPRS